MKNIIIHMFGFLFFTIKCVLALLFITAIFVGITVYQNNNIEVTVQKIKNNKIPKSFDGYKIAHVSDIQNEYSGEKLTKLLNKIKKNKPDIIVITGDLVDAQKYDVDSTLEVVKGLVNIAPTYFVYGNHDFGIDGDSCYQRMYEYIEEAGVIILNNKYVEISEGEDSINLVGIQDPATVWSIPWLNELSAEEEKIESMLKNTLDDVDEDKFTILLSHRPEYFEIYCKFNIDLALTGHAHGGQFRIPFIGGVYAPNQGFFPKYTEGVHTQDNTSMVISRGLGNSRFPIRIFNTPELVIVSLEK